jgi:hypothetical protein
MNYLPQLKELLLHSLVKRYPTENTKLYFFDVNDEIEALLKETLPHGSGIDCDWCFTFQKNGKIKCSNSWHKMDDNGFYCGFTDFYFTIDIDTAYRSTPTSNKVTRIILSPIKMSKGERSGVREYLDEMFYSFECELNN